jgi:phage shock protein PspC (stress-responsive transcriptional regulator)
MEKKLYRDEYHKKIAGVCAGLAEYFGVDVSVVRLIFVLTCIFHGGGLLVYVILWIVLPKRPYPYFDPTVDYTVPPQNPGAQNTAAPGNNPFGGNPYQGNPFGGSPFTNPPMPPKHNSTSVVAIVIGVVLIIVGGSILLDNFDLIPDWDFANLWPVILIIVGCAIMISGERKKPMPVDWDKKAENKDDKTDTEDKTETNPPADNPPVV